MSVSTAIRTRRSIRRFQDTALQPGQLERVLDLALEAPSSWNYQARSVVVVSSQEQREALSAAANGQRQPLHAPVTLVFVAEAEAWRADQSDVFEQARCNRAWSEEFIASTRQGGQRFQWDLAERGLTREYAVKDAMIAASFLMLAATEEGLATSPMNGWNEEEVKKVIGIAGADHLAIALLLSLGAPAEQRRHPGRRASKHSVFHGNYPATANAGAR